MLCYLNRGQTRYRRTLSAVLAVLWLNLIALPCVMAQPFSAAGEDCISCPAEDGAAQASAMDCASAQHCAVMLDEQPGALAKALPYAMTPPVMQPLWAQVLPEPRAVFQPPSSYYSTLTTLERLPVLRI